ncbi:MAG: F0F1 ATP synthase subunit A [Nitrospirota bacterium]
MEEAPLIFHIEGIPPYVTYSWVAMAILIVFAVIVRRRLAFFPSGIQNIAEIVIDGLHNFSEGGMGHKANRIFFPLIGTLGLYILVCNLMGLIPGFESPTSNINTTASMAICVFLSTHYLGIRVHGLKYFGHFFGPIRSIPAIPLMILIFIIEIIAHFARPVTLSVRLFGNMISKHMMLLILAILAPLAFYLPLQTPILILGVLVGVVQAFVFLLLSTLYLAGAAELEEHEGH